MADFQTRTQMVMPSPSKLFTPAVTTIIALLIAGFALATYFPGFTVRYLGLSSQGVFSGKLWQVITYSLINPCASALIFNGIMVLFIGSSIERVWRTRSFVLLWVVVSVVCAVLWMLVSLVLGQNMVGMGSAACGYGLIAAFGILNYRKRVFTLLCTIEAQYLAMIFIGIGIVISIASPFNLIWVSGALVAYLYIKWTLRRRTGTKTVDSFSRGGGSGFVDID